jgi:2-iminobutanoate/2-iminopropanoate deaminase
MSAPVGPYSPVVAAGPWLICSGQLGLVPPGPGSGASASADPPPVLVEGGAVAQLGQALANATRLLGEHGASLHDVVKTTVFLTDMDDAPGVNRAYVECFGDHRPARSMVAVAGLPMGAAVEVEVWAYLDRPAPG